MAGIDLSVVTKDSELMFVASVSARADGSLVCERRDGVSDVDLERVFFRCLACMRKRNGGEDGGEIMAGAGTSPSACGAYPLQRGDWR